MIIFNDKSKLERLMRKGFEKFINNTDLHILCRAYREEGLKNSEIYTKIVSFCRKWRVDFNEAHYQDKILRAIEGSDKKKISSHRVVFNSYEIGRIKELKEHDLMKFAFVCMCLAKKDGVDFIYLNTNGIYKLSDICSLAGIKKTKKQQEAYLHLLYLKGFLDCDLKPLLRCRFLHIRDGGDELLNFIPDVDLIMNFESLFSEDIVRCSKCDKLMYDNFKIPPICKYCSEKSEDK